jgi:hypothetical protein
MHNGYNNMKRQRGRGRKPGGGGGHHNNYQNQHPNRAMESSGPEVKVRGPASHIYERYLQLSRDATSAGDRVLGENYAQHADHYFRLVRAMQPAMPPPQQRSFNEGEFEGDEPQSAEGGDEAQASNEEGGDQPEADFAPGENQQQQQFNRDRDGDPRRRRGRRNRFRPEGERAEGEAREGGEPSEAREERGERAPEPRAERPERRERQPRERDAEPSGPEGFSTGPKPAFLRDS